jgi:hypothetical protein
LVELGNVEEKRVFTYFKAPFPYFSAGVKKKTLKSEGYTATQAQICSGSLLRYLDQFLLRG